jgi:hypothetical protein
MQRALNAIQMQGNSDEEAEQDKIPREEPPEPANLPEQHPVQEDRLMNISIAAYTGTPSDSTISLLLHIKGAKALALADTGSTDTFLDYKFATQHNIQMEPASQEK